MTVEPAGLAGPWRSDAGAAGAAGDDHTSDDHRWSIALPGFPSSERLAESLGALANGHIGTRATLEEHGPGSSPLVVVEGVYSSGEDPGLLPGPLWTRLDIRDPTTTGTPQRDAEEHGAAAQPGPDATEAPGRVRVLDLRTGVLHRRTRDDSGLETLRFVSMAAPDLLALRAEAPVGQLVPGCTLTPPPSPTPALPADAQIRYEEERRGSVWLARTSAPSGGSIAMAAHDRNAVVGDRVVVERLVTWVASDSGPADWDVASRRLDDHRQQGFDQLLLDHEHAWATCWSDAAVHIDGAPGDQLAARLAVFHLIASARDEDDAAVGARGLTGPAYGGHVFWDAEVFVLPALAAIRPDAARAMLEYRIRRLGAARDAAAREGQSGARFPWESARDGSDVTPRFAEHPAVGELVPILTGEHQEHIVADIAWAADRYAAWTGDNDFLRGHARDLVLDTARYWADRIHVGPDGSGHITDVMGPDEYHHVVDDSAFSNVMARWNLRRGADLLDELNIELNGSGSVHTSGHEPNPRRNGSASPGAGEGSLQDRWRHLAAELVDGYDPTTGLYQQFDGYFGLQPLLVEHLAPPPVAADMVFGRERIANSQLIKQADVLMLHHMVPIETAPGSLHANLAYYEPRTAHGSSLSPAIHAALHARAGNPDRALELFRMAARLDLDDLTGTTAGGLHLATMGGLWQALAHGFLGLQLDGDVLVIDPCLPSEWEALSLRLRFRGHPIGVRADHMAITVDAAEPLEVRIGCGPVERFQPGVTRRRVTRRLHGDGPHDVASTGPTSTIASPHATTRTDR